MLNYQSIQPWAGVASRRPVNENDIESTSTLGHIEIKAESNSLIRRLPLRAVICILIGITFSCIISNKIRDPNSFESSELNVGGDFQKDAKDAKKFLTSLVLHEEDMIEEERAPELGFPGIPIAQKRPLVYLNGPDAYSLLLDSTPGTNSISPYSSNVFLLLSGLDVQLYPEYSGAASVASVLNSLRFGQSSTNAGVDIPADNMFPSFRYATQTNIFNACTSQHVISNVGGGPGIDGLLTPPFGLTVDQVANLMQCHLNATSDDPWKVATTFVDETHMTVGKMRFDIKSALEDPDSRVLVNYDLSQVGQGSGGHWSPIGGYSEKQDAFLVLDVAKYIYPPAWIPTERLFDGLSGLDKCGKWNFPYAQAALSKEERAVKPENVDNQILSKLGCQPQLRGYIVVSKSS
jgi:hypothetical protein